MRLRIARAVLVSCSLFVILDVISCRIFDDVMSTADADGLIRASIDTPTGRNVSYISGVTTETGVQRLIFVPWNAEPEIGDAILRLASEPAPTGRINPIENITD